MSTEKEIKESLKQGGDRKVKLAVTDIDGVLRGKYMHIDKFNSALDGGFGFCNVIFGWDSSDVCYEDAGIEYTGWHSGYPDAEARIDPKTFRRVPWDNNVPFVLADFVNEKGKALSICPRRLLRGVESRAKDAGYEAVFGMEFEWFNFRETPQSLEHKHHVRPEPITPGMFGYSLLRANHSQEFFNALMDELYDFGVPVEGLHTETGPGVF